MADGAVSDAALDLVWSLWTELGVPGPWRRHQRAILDPERLILATPWFARADPRLADLAFSWCVQHGQRVSGTRLASFHRSAHPDVRTTAEPFLGELASAGVRWFRVSPEPARPREHREVELHLERPGLLRLRTRALAGVGGRADVLVSLLSAPGTWASASSLDEVGLSKRNVARVLSDLAEAGIAHSRWRGNVREFRLASPAALGEVLGLPRDAVFPDWGAVFEWMRLADEIAALPAERPASRRVEVARRREEVVRLGTSLGFAMPAPAGTSGEELVDWVGERARAIADGTAVAVGG